MSAVGSLAVDVRRHRIDAAMVAVATLIAIFMVDRHGHFITDDAFITLRYAKHLAAGHGYVFNPGEDPVEGFTNLSHVWLGASSIQLGIEPLTTLRFVNRAAFVALPGTVYLLSYRLAGRTAAAAAAAVLVAVHPALAHWSGSGLETASFAWLVTASFAVAVAPVARWRSALLVVLVFATVTTRPDGIVVPLLLVGLGLHRALSGRDPTIVADQLLSWALPAALLVAAVHGWRHATFGHWLPNSAHYKAGGDDTASLVRDFVVQNLWLFALLPFTRWRALGRGGVALYGLVAAYFVGFFDVAPSVSSLHRFFLPVFPAVVVLATSAVLRLDDLELGPVRKRAVAAVVLAALAWADLSGKAGDEKALTRADSLNDRMRSRFELAVAIAETLPPDGSVALGDVGAVGYMLPHHVYDAFGLNSTRFTHVLDGHRGKYVAWVRQQQPDVIVVVSRDTDRLDAVYKTGEYLTAGETFKYEYRRIAVTKSDRPYHYFVYRRPRKVARRWRASFDRRGPLPEVFDRAKARIAAAASG